MLLAAFEQRRPTRDLDVHARQLAGDADTVRDLIADIAALEVDDGLDFDTSGAAAQVIREDDHYSGVRVSLSVRMHTAKLTVKVDVNVGDPIWPAPEGIALPRLLAGEPLALLGYPLHMVLAEKLVTAIDRGTANTRWRNFADLFLLTRQHPVAGSELTEATRRVAEYRGVELALMADVLDGLAELAQARWVAWTAKQDLTDRLPEAFAEVSNAVIAFGDPVISGTVADANWRPESAAWDLDPRDGRYLEPPPARGDHGTCLIDVGATVGGLGMKCRRPAQGSWPGSQRVHHVRPGGSAIPAQLGTPVSPFRVAGANGAANPAGERGCLRIPTASTRPTLRRPRRASSPPS